MSTHSVTLRYPDARSGSPKMRPEVLSIRVLDSGDLEFTVPNSIDPWDACEAADDVMGCKGAPLYRTDSTGWRHWFQPDGALHGETQEEADARKRAVPS